MNKEEIMGKLRELISNEEKRSEHEKGEEKTSSVAKHFLFVANEYISDELKKNGKEGEFDILKIRREVEPWLTAVFQSEHLSLLVGSGLSIAMSNYSDMMSRIDFEHKEYKDKIKQVSGNQAKELGRGEANFEDDLRVAIDLLKGYEIQNNELKDSLKQEINKNLTTLLKNILNAEKNIKEENLPILKSFLLSFASRTASKDRLNIFTTNYDRFLEYGLDEAGILILDRFIGKIKPIMRFHRIDLDYHYNPPGIRGEPRYVEGVVRFTKLHGSIDWQFEQDIFGQNRIVKIPLLFGADVSDDFFNEPYEKVVIFPNSSKAVETSYFPYSELFRDFSTAICRPNSVLVTYGYGFGDSHINRIILDMLTIPSTHLVIISYGIEERVVNFIEKCNLSQLTILLGDHLGNLNNLSQYYLPKPAIDRITDRQAKIVEKRGKLNDSLKFSEGNENNV